ncbi:hypothetical protein [Bordetella flabilis]|uniref:Uncharacterized protein n=1 Tax=Bordetella flabilis TaxID=463014 RepID=A0A193GMV5_9BORD|nr:hypothetical protein [Bordetella flabilis]ANN80816.1 hypothetical protein BAU07_26165 [Bordetella flabilis]
MRVGAVYFDESGNIVANDRTVVALSDAWASVGGEPARRVQSVHDLASDVLWLTNLTWNNFFKAGLSRHPNFRSDGWLRTLFGQITTELGVHGSDVSPDITVSAMATVAQRVADVATNDYKVRVKSARLNDDFATAINAPASALPDAYYPFFEGIADHPSVSVIQTANYSASSPTVTLRRNRLAHAAHVLATPVPPDAGWELERSVGSGSDQWLESIKTPFLVRCTISNVNPLMAEVLSWGSGSRQVREWLTDLEWRIVREFANVNVHAALICSKEAQVLPQAAMLPSGSMAQLSYTLGLVAEQVWTAMVSRQRYKDTTRYTAAAAWLRSCDRMTMFDYAQRLHARGVVVMSYGVGNVVARYPEGGLRRTLDIATDLALMPPASKFSEARVEGARA